MVEYYISSIAKYTYADDKFYKNGIPLLDENGDDINEILFKRFIKKETANFIHQNYSNIIVLIGAGASVLCRNNAIDKRFGKTVAMLADLINTELKQNSQYYSLQELSNFCKYTIPVEIAGDDAELKLNPAFNLEDFLSDLLSFEKYVSSSDYDKYVLSKNKILELIVSNTSYEYDNSCLKHSAFINTVSHLVRTPSKLTMTYHDKKFRLPEFMTVGVSEKVYLANKVVVQKYLESIETTSSSEVQLQPFATYLDMDEAEVSLKPSTLFDHHLFVVGATNSGKSTSALSILDKIIIANKKTLIIDPTGEYVDSFSDEEVKKLNLGIDTTISPGKISMQQWSMLFETNSNTQSAVLAEAIHSLRYQQKNGQTSCLVKAGQNIAQLQQELASVSKIDIDFNISLLPEQIAAESVSEPNRGSDYVYDTFKANANSYLIQKVTYQLSNTNFLKFFNYDPQLLNLLDEIESFIHTPNISLYINTSTLGASEGIGGMIIDLICNYIISQSGIIPFVFFIDEVHRYTKSQYSEEEFHKGLTLVAREGRKKGIFLFLTSQNPQDVSPVLLGQIGTLLIHRLTHNDEIRAIKNHLDDYSIKQVKKLNQGESILTSINLMQNIFLHVIKCNRKQDNDTPTL